MAGERRRDRERERERERGGGGGAVHGIRVNSISDKAGNQKEKWPPWAKKLTFCRIIYGQACIYHLILAL